ncbi:MAG: sulfite exporter TauE/SafE family protein [Sphingomonadales bacterium]|nr:sulfite exporter TauE/SafE family protein [Sphingomonadales bacterium]MDE2567818.1 sulfite exporter TauE/SafE family protein [Sphingomonadales bacterium]
MLAALAAAFVRGLAGFGMAILLVPLLGLVIAPAEAVVISNMLGLLVGIASIRVIRGAGELSTALPIGLLAVLLTPVGLLLLAATPPQLARVLIALVAIGAFAIVMFPVKPGRAPGRLLTGATGVAAGLLTGFAGMPGPPIVPYYLRRAVAPATARASMMSVFLMTSIASTASALLLGLGGRREALIAGALLPSVLLGNWLGGRAFGRVGAAAWRGFVGVMLALAGLMALSRLLLQ